MTRRITTTYLLLIFTGLANAVPDDETDWAPIVVDAELSQWDVKQNEYTSRRLDKNVETKFFASGQEITVSSSYRSKGAFLCTKKSYGKFILELEVKVPSTKTNAFIGYHGQWLPEKIKNRKQPFKNLYCFTFPLGNWPKSTGGSEIRYNNTRNPKTDGKNLAPGGKEFHLTPEKWHKVRIEVGENHIIHSVDGQVINELRDVRAIVADQPMSAAIAKWQGPIILGMNDHPKGTKPELKITCRNLRIHELK